jgi:hypothetical protein
VSNGQSLILPLLGIWQARGGHVVAWGQTHRKWDTHTRVWHVVMIRYFLWHFQVLSSIMSNSSEFRNGEYIMSANFFS